MGTLYAQRDHLNPLWSVASRLVQIRAVRLVRDIATARVVYMRRPLQRARFHEQLVKVDSR